MTRTRPITFLPPANNAHRNRLILMVSDEEYTTLEHAAKLLGWTPTDIIRYAFETSVLPGIIRETSHLMIDTPPPTITQAQRSKPKRIAKAQPANTASKLPAIPGDWFSEYSPTDKPLAIPADWLSEDSPTDKPLAIPADWLSEYSPTPTITQAQHTKPERIATVQPPNASSKLPAVPDDSLSEPNTTQAQRGKAKRIAKAQLLINTSNKLPVRPAPATPPKTLDQEDSDDWLSGFTDFVE